MPLCVKFSRILREFHASAKKLLTRGAGKRSVEDFGFIFTKEHKGNEGSKHERLKIAG
jgi:hypothetical protein